MLLLQSSLGAGPMQQLRPAGACHLLQAQPIHRRQSVVAMGLAGCNGPLSRQLIKQLGVPTLSPLRGLGQSSLLQPGSRRGERLVSRVAADVLPSLGYDFLTFLATTVVVVPLFKRLKVSPVLGFLVSGVVLQHFGIFKDIKDDSRLAELGVLFLLFDMGLELSLDRLKALAKYAFGMGGLSAFLTTLVFTLFALPAGQSAGTLFLEKVVHAPHELVSIRSVDEALIIGAALSMSSSAFVLQLLQERGEMATRYGSATLGILLYQDIAVVPFLVLMPLLEGGNTLDVDMFHPTTLLAQLGPTAVSTFAGLAALLLGGRFLLRRVFEVVAQSRSSETFVALSLLTVTGASYLTSKLGFSDTLGAFIAGVLLSETSYRTQVEADIQPFRGLLLGLFFVTTGCSINLGVLYQNWDIVVWMLVGLLAVKTTVISMVGPLAGLSRGESIRIGFLLSQGGEFAFVLLSLANRLEVLPLDLNQLLIIVVVMSMALTPVLAEVGKRAGDHFEAEDRAKALKGGEDPCADGGHEKAMGARENAVLICGFGPQGQMLANMLQSEVGRQGTKSQSYVAFDLDPLRVSAARDAGFDVLFGDGCRMSVLKAAGVVTPRSIIVCHSAREHSIKAVEALRQNFHSVPIYACAIDMTHAAQLDEAGATQSVIATAEAGLVLGQRLLGDLGCSDGDVLFLKRGMEQAMLSRQAALGDGFRKVSGKRSPEGGGAPEGDESSDEGGGGGSNARNEIFVLDPGRQVHVCSPVPAEDPAARRGLLQPPGMVLCEECEEQAAGLRSGAGGGAGPAASQPRGEDLAVSAMAQLRAATSSTDVGEGKNGNGNGNGHGKGGGKVSPEVEDATRIVERF